MMIEMTIADPILKRRISMLIEKAYHVERMTIGLRIGAVSRYIISDRIGTPFFANPAATGTDEQSQTGKIMDAMRGAAMDPSLLLSRNRTRKSCLTKRLMMDEKIVPARRKGKA